jgi:2-oxoisovalerate dehydrogenase E1 component beta subunit
MVAINLLEAINKALDYALEQDNNVILLGQDIGTNGGVFRATENLYNKYGKDRVIDMPLAENLIAGVAVGMASQGLIPIAEIQFLGFIYPALDQIINHAARMKTRTSGAITCNTVFRAPLGSGINAPEHHFESIEAIFAHIPNLTVVIPSSPAKAYGLLLASIMCDDPVIFLEPTKLYRSQTESFTPNGKALQLGKCFRVKEGSDITIVSWGSMLIEAIEAANYLQETGISAEIIDVATIKPLDIETILKSVRKTGRIIIAHEAVKTLGVGAEIAALVAEYALDSLCAPIKRVAAPDQIITNFKEEKYFFPNKNDIIATTEELMGY